MMTCTAYSASFCPVCGDCSCSKIVQALLETDAGTACFDSIACPLHSVDSKHAETVRLERMRELTKKMAEDQGITLTENDETIVARFAQFLHEKSERDKQNKDGAS